MNGEKANTPGGQAPSAWLPERILALKEHIQTRLPQWHLSSDTEQEAMDYICQFVQRRVTWESLDDGRFQGDILDRGHEDFRYARIAEIWPGSDRLKKLCLKERILADISSCECQWCLNDETFDRIGRYLLSNDVQGDDPDVVSLTATVKRGIEDVRSFILQRLKNARIEHKVWLDVLHLDVHKVELGIRHRFATLGLRWLSRRAGTQPSSQRSVDQICDSEVMAHIRQNRESTVFVLVSHFVKKDKLDPQVTSVVAEAILDELDSRDHELLKRFDYDLVRIVKYLYNEHLRPRSN